MTARFLSVEDAQALMKRAVSLSVGGGETTVRLDSNWTGNLRVARNQVITAGDVRNNELQARRDIRGASGESSINQIDDAHLVTLLRRAERLVHLGHETPLSDRRHPFFESYPRPPIWSDATYGLDAAARADGLRTVIAPVVAAGMHAAAYVEVSAHGRATMDGDRVWYYPYTLAQFTVTVRDPAGGGSGWAGVDHNDWARMDAAHLSAIALDKCLRSRNPVAIEPGFYTTIFEPQAVCDLVKWLFTPASLDRETAEAGKRDGPADSPFYNGDSREGTLYHRSAGVSKIGELVIDRRLTVSSDPMDPDLGYPPFLAWQVQHPATWIKEGVLQDLAYYRDYAVKQLGKDTGGLPSTGSFRMQAVGETASVADRIATTKRGLLVTRLGGVDKVPGNAASMLLTGYTRDGVWLIENGKITKPVKNFRFTDSPLIALNNIEQIGVPQRVFRPDAPDRLPDGYAPVIVPALKVRDFRFTSLADSV
jgi:predicted Zn-dependent protease